MNAEEARKHLAKLEEEKRIRQLEFLKCQLERVQNSIKNEVEKGRSYLNMDVFDPLQPDTEKWLRANGYSIESWNTYLIGGDGEPKEYKRIRWGY